MPKIKCTHCGSTNIEVLPLRGSVLRAHCKNCGYRWFFTKKGTLRIR